MYIAKKHEWITSLLIIKCVVKHNTETLGLINNVMNMHMKAVIYQ